MTKPNTPEIATACPYCGTPGAMIQPAELPPRQVSRPNPNPVFAEAKANPGRVYRLAIGRKASGFPTNRRAEGFRFAARRQANRTYTIYVWWPEEEKEEAS